MFGVEWGVRDPRCEEALEKSFHMSARVNGGIQEDSMEMSCR